MAVIGPAQGSRHRGRHAAFQSLRGVHRVHPADTARGWEAVKRGRRRPDLKTNKKNECLPWPRLCICDMQPPISPDGEVSTAAAHDWPPRQNDSFGDRDVFGHEALQRLLYMCRFSAIASTFQRLPDHPFAVTNRLNPPPPPSETSVRTGCIHRCQHVRGVVRD